MKYRVLSGTIYIGGKWYNPGDILESASPLPSSFLDCVELVEGGEAEEKAEEKKKKKKEG